MECYNCLAKCFKLYVFWALDIPDNFSKLAKEVMPKALCGLRNNLNYISSGF